MPEASRCSNFSRPQDPPVCVVKHTLYGPLPHLHGKTHTLWPIPVQYGPTGSPNSPNIASMQAHSARTTTMYTLVLALSTM
jgi:hypothetical protein